ncbi:MAG: hypothetical protein OXU61_02150 [Gammaproteobacteria bacterium]|nr:hypothetical protein [Gammaproteobacteria bacterium]
MARAQLYQEHPTQTDDEQYQENTYQEEWMYLCQLNPTFTSNEQQLDSVSDSVDWELAAAQMEPTVLLSFPNWIYSNRAQTTTDFQLPTRQVDISSLNTAQRKAYDIVADHHTAQSASPLKMMVLGTAGTGKSFLISCQAQLLQDRCLLTGTTGNAGFNIDGITIHSALQLPIQQSAKKVGHPLQVSRIG